MSARLPVIGLMLGDVTGIGPEISAKLLSGGPAARHNVRLAVIGDARVLELGARDAGVNLAWRTYEPMGAVDWSRPELPVIDLGNIDPSQFQRGAGSAESGRLAGETLKYMIDQALAGQLDGICFAPLNKGAMHQGGWKFHDEHQMFAKLTDHQGFFGEMNVIPEFCTFRVTSHVALREAVDLITPERITAAVQLADTTLRAMGKERPRIGVAALNPHNGDNGSFGREELDIIAPAVRSAQALGIAADGPYPADTIFLKVQGDARAFDAVVTMYHDQGQIAIKLMGFSRGVTVQGGLPIPITTPAHGTAFDIAGQGVADHGSLVHAVRLAADLAARRVAAR